MEVEEEKDVGADGMDDARRLRGAVTSEDSRCSSSSAGDSPERDDDICSLRVRRAERAAIFERDWYEDAEAEEAVAEELRCCGWRRSATAR